MASKIIVDQLEKTGGSTTALTLPTSNASASQYLQNDGAGALSWATVSIPAGGLSFAQQWRLSANATIGTSETYLYANWEKPESEDSPGVIGADMAVDATTSATLSGAWTFPDTGVWYVAWRCQTYFPGGTHGLTTKMWTTDDNGSSWYEAAKDYGYEPAGGYDNCLVDYIVSISDTTNDKLRVSGIADAHTNVVQGNTDVNQCALTFIKLGD
jgi:hypothetical protein